MSAFAAYAITSPNGPHVTVQAGVEVLGTVVTTTSRASFKAGVIRRVPWTAVTFAGAGHGFTVLGGHTQVLDPRRPCDLARSPVESAVAAAGVLGLAAINLDQVRGYLEVGAGVPSGWRPLDRVVLVTQVAGRLEADSDGTMRASGIFEGAERSLGRLRARRSPTRWRPDAVLAGSPPAAVTLATTSGPAWFGFGALVGNVAVPGVWDGDLGVIRIPRAALERLGVETLNDVCVTRDQSSNRRPDAKAGVMLRGRGALVAFDGADAVVAVVPKKITHWEGFSSGTREVVW